MALKCPKCNIKVTYLFKCCICGDVRCNSSGEKACNSSKSPYEKVKGTAVNRKCYVCKKRKR